jgi:hypothetical protein
MSCHIVLNAGPFMRAFCGQDKSAVRMVVIQIWLTVKSAA